MRKDSPIHGSKLKYSYPSIQFSQSILSHQNNQWLVLFLSSLPFHVFVYENMQMNQQVDRILRQTLSKLSKKVNEIIVEFHGNTNVWHCLLLRKSKQSRTFGFG